MKSVILCLAIALIAVIPCESNLQCGEDNILSIDDLKTDAANVKKNYEEALEIFNNPTSYTSNSAFRIDVLTKYHYALVKLRQLQSALETYFFHYPTEDGLGLNITMNTLDFLTSDSTSWNFWAHLPVSVWTVPATNEHSEAFRQILSDDIAKISLVIERLGLVKSIDKRQMIEMMTVAATFITNPPFFRPNGPLSGPFFPDLGDLNFGSILLLIPTLFYILFNIFFAPFIPSFIKPKQ